MRRPTPIQAVRVIDSHTEGEPTRVVLPRQIDLGRGSLQERLHRFRTQADHLRTGILAEPRGSEVLVGALLTRPVEAGSTVGVIFFNDVGYLGMCGHGTIGVITTLAHQRKIEPGLHRVETPVGIVTALLSPNGQVTVSNVPSYRYRARVPLDVPGFGIFTGDIAWGGNWFFLIGEHPFTLDVAHRQQLLAATSAIRSALAAQGITGPEGAPVDHIELFAPPVDPRNSSRNFVLCPGAAFDRSPCGTGTSAKMACMHADGRLGPHEPWLQEGILGTVFEGCIEQAGDGVVHPSIRGRAWITAETTLLFSVDDPFVAGVHF